MADKELDQLGGGTALLSSELNGDMLVYIVTDEGDSRFTTLDALKTFVNTDPTEVPASEPLVGAKLAATAGLLTSGANIALAWSSAVFDTNSFWSGGSPTRITIPSGVTKVEIVAGLRTTGAAANNQALSIMKNGSTEIAQQASNSGFATTNVMVSTGVIEVTAGDYFEVIYHLTATSRTLVVDRTFASIHALEHTI